MIDLCLSDKYYAHWPEIKKLALSDEPQAFEKLKKYALEGYGSHHSHHLRGPILIKRNRSRLSTPSFGLIRVTGADKIDVQDGPDVVSVKSEDTVFTNFITAGLDPSKFPDPYEIELDRPDNSTSTMAGVPMPVSGVPSSLLREPACSAHVPD